MTFLYIISRKNIDPEEQATVLQYILKVLCPSFHGKISHFNDFVEKVFIEI